MLRGLAERLALQAWERGSFDVSGILSRLLKDALSFRLGSASSELTVPIRPLKRLSPRRLPNAPFFSPGVRGCAETPPREKLPKAPIGAYPADCGAADQGEEGPGSPALTGPVAVRLRAPNGDTYAEPSESLLSLSLSPTWCPKPSFRSVRRLRRDGGGVDMSDSSLEAFCRVFGETKVLADSCRDSLVSRRRIPRRVDGEAPLYAFVLA